MSNSPEKDQFRPSPFTERFSVPSGRAFTVAGTGNLPLLADFEPPSFQPIASSEKLDNYIGQIVQDVKQLKPPITNVYTQYHSLAGLSSPTQASNTGSPETRPSLSYNNNYRTTIGSASPSKLLAQSSYTLETMTAFLASIGASNHPDMERLYRLSNMWTHARQLPEKDETIFNALCCCFFEKILTMDSKDVSKSTVRALYTQEEWVKSQMFLFVTLLKGLAQDPSDPNRTQKFYEAVIRSPNLYQKGIASFKEVLEKLLKEVGNNQGPASTLFFKWMNELDKVTQDICMKLASLLEANLKIFVMTGTSFREEVFLATKLSNEMINESKDYVVFYHKQMEQAYILCSNTGEIPSNPVVQKDKVPVQDTSAERKFASVPIVSETVQEAEPIFKVQSNNARVIKYQDSQQQQQQQQVELRYGTVQIKKPKVLVSEPETIKKQQYNAPVHDSNLPPGGQWANPNNNGEDIDSHWLSNDSFSDMPNHPDGPNGNILSGSILCDSLAFDDDAFTGDGQSGSMNKLGMARTFSDDSRSYGSYGNARTVQWKEPGLLDLLEDVWEKDSHQVEQKAQAQQQSSNKAVIVVQREADPFNELDFKRVDSYKEGEPANKYKSEPIKIAIIPDDLRLKHMKINQKLVSHNAEFEEATLEHVTIAEEKFVPGLFPKENIQGIVEYYNDMMDKKKELQTPTSQPLSAMRMDDGDDD